MSNDAPDNSKNFPERVGDTPADDNDNADAATGADAAEIHADPVPSETDWLVYTSQSPLD